MSLLATISKFIAGLAFAAVSIFHPAPQTKLSAFNTPTTGGSSGGGGAATTTINGTQSASFTIQGASGTSVTTNGSTITVSSTLGLLPANNLSDLANSSTARTNLGVSIGSGNVTLNSVSSGTAGSITYLQTTGSSTISSTAAIAVSSTAILQINPDGTATDTFLFGSRQNINIPVPYVTPTQNNQNIAFDLFPHGPSVGNGFGNSIYGVTWEDICSTDIVGSTSYECLHIGKSADSGAGTGYANISLSQAGGGQIQPLVFQAFGGNVEVGNSNTSSAPLMPSSTLSVDGTVYIGSTTVSMGDVSIGASANNGLLSVVNSAGTNVLGVSTSTTNANRFQVESATGTLPYLGVTSSGVPLFLGTSTVSLGGASLALDVCTSTVTTVPFNLNTSTDMIGNTYPIIGINPSQFSYASNITGTNTNTSTVTTQVCDTLAAGSTPTATKYLFQISRVSGM